MIQPSFTRSKWVHWESVVRAQKQKISPILIILNAKNVVLQSWNFKFLQKSVARTDYIFGKIKLWSLFFCTIFLDGTGCQVIYHPCLWEKATLWGHENPSPKRFANLHLSATAVCRNTLTDFRLKCVIIITSKSEFLWKLCYCGYGKW